MNSSKTKETNVNANDYLSNLLSDGAKIPVDEDVNSYDIQYPDWYDEKRVKRGQKFFWNNYFSNFVAMFCGLLTILVVPTILKVLEHTGKSETEYKCFKRYMETILHTLKWFQYDIKPGTDAWKSITAVRKMHVTTSCKAIKNKIGMVSQKDMALTQFGFMGFTILRPYMIGIANDRQGMEDYIHLFRVIGHLMGIHDKFNMCAETLDETVERLDAMAKLVFRPAFQVENGGFIKMTKDISDGLWHINPALDHEAFIYFIKRLTGVPGYTYWSKENKDGKPSKEFLKLSWTSRFTLFVLIVRLEILMKYNIFRIYFNFNQHIDRLLAHYFPVLAMISYGIKRAYIRIF